MKKEEIDIWELDSQIRDFINIERNRKRILENKGKFHQMCACLDTIQDTEYGIHSYMDSYPSELKKDKGFLYLTTYGLYQLMYVQQDAIQNLSEVLGVEFKRLEQLKIIRDIRNRSTGHPTKQGFTKKNAVKTFNHILHNAFSYNGFRLWTFYSDQRPREETECNNVEIINQNREFCGKLLNNILEKLKDDENTHRKKFMKDKLSKIFDQSSYLFEKVREVFSEPGSLSFSRGNFKDLIKKIEEFDKKLEERKEEGSIEHIKDDLKYPIEKVNDFFHHDSNVDKEAAEIFVWYIQEKFKSLEQIAKDTDEVYETEV
jgi:hypothetical protein